MNFTMARITALLSLFVVALVQLVEAGKHGAGGGSFGLAGEYLALEMIENRCASQVGKFIKGSHLMATIGTVVHLGDTTGTVTPGLMAAAGGAAQIGAGAAAPAVSLQQAPAGGMAAVNPAAMAAAGVGRKLMGRGAAVPPGVDLSEEAYRREVCTIAAGIVDQYCVGAPDDRGVTAVQTWLQALGCTAVVVAPQQQQPAAAAAGAGFATGGVGK